MLRAPAARERCAMAMITEITAEREQTVLLGWLRLLGWTVVIDRDGNQWVGLARRADRMGLDLCVRGSASSHRELVSKLFSRAVHGLALQAA
jgi:hypothetical protein